MAFLATGCATPRKSRLVASGTGFALGLGVGAATAPKDENPSLHAMYWAGLLGLGALVASEFYFSEQDEVEKMRLENQKLQAEMEFMRNANTVLLKQGQGYFKGAAGDEYFQGAQAKWRLYQADRWIKEGPNRLFHADRIVEILPSNEVPR